VRLERLHPDHRYQSDAGVLQLPLPRPRPEDLVAWVASTLRELFAAPKR
jgi:hypothetical protein